MASRVPEKQGASEYLVSSGVTALIEEAMEKMLTAALHSPYQEVFNPLDFIVFYLYKHNPEFALERGSLDALWDIPFVQKIWKDTPRKELPLSARLTRNDAAVIIQAAWRGYVARNDEVIQDFRAWQRGVQQEKKAANVVIGCLKNLMEKKRALQDGNSS